MNTTEWMAASKILKRAADLIQDKGWQQGAVEPVPQHCLATALEGAFREGDFSIVDFNYAREALARVLHIEREPRPDPNDGLAVPYWGRGLMEWNDTSGRTMREVIAACRRASQLAHRLHKEGSG